MSPVIVDFRGGPCVDPYAKTGLMGNFGLGGDFFGVRPSKNVTVESELQVIRRVHFDTA